MVTDRSGVGGYSRGGIAHALEYQFKDSDKDKDLKFIIETVGIVATVGKDSQKILKLNIQKLSSKPQKKEKQS